MKKLITISFLVLGLVSCSNVVPSTPAVVPTFEPLPSALPADTLQIPTSAPPTVETLASGMPDPQGTPVQEWRGIPIMPEAVAGQEFNENNTYSFKANITAKDVQDFYNQELTNLGWSQPFNNPFDANGGMMTFRKVGSSLAITVMASEGSVVVLLVLTQA